MKRLLTLILLAAPFVFGAGEPAITRIFQLKYADPQLIVRLVAPSAVRIDSDRQLKAVSVTASKEAFPEIEQLIARFDVPPPPVRNIEVTIYLMSALNTPSSAPIPAEMEPVVKQLKGMFSYKGYQLIDTQVIRVREGLGGEASAVVDGKSVASARTVSQMKFRAVSTSVDEKGRAVKVDGLRVGLRIPVPDSKGGYSYIDTGINTDVDIREGQKVVVGKANMEGSDRASIVVLSAKVLE